MKIFEMINLSNIFIVMFSIGDIILNAQLISKLIFHSVPTINIHEFICFKNPFCFSNISAPSNRTELVLYSKFAHGSQFSGEKNDLKI